MSISGFLIGRKDILNYVLQKIDYNKVAGLNIVTSKMVIKCQKKCFQISNPTFHYNFSVRLLPIELENIVSHDDP